MNKVIFIIRYCFFTTTHVCRIYIKVVDNIFLEDAKAKYSYFNLFLAVQTLPAIF